MKKVILSIFFLLGFLFFANNSYAQQPAYPLNTNPDVKQDFHTYTQSVFIEILASGVCILGGVDVLSENGRCLGIDPVSRKIGYVDSHNSVGLVGVMGKLISSTYNLPASSGTYVQYLASNFGITHSSYAQAPEEICAGLPPDAIGNCINHQQRLKDVGFGTGIGFEGLRPVLDIWKVFRNLSYMIFILIFIIIGLGIMFRINIDARAVMTVQNQIPKIIVALIFITLSYAIAGFLIDMMYVSIYVIVNLFSSQNLGTVNNMTNPFSAVSSLGGIGSIASPAAEGATGILKSIFEGALGGQMAKIVETILGTFLGGSAGGGIGAIAGGLIGGTVGLLGGPGAAMTGAGAGISIGRLAGTAIGGAIGVAKGPSIIEFVAGLILYIIIVVAIIQSLFRTWVNLIKAYIFILLDVILAPFFIMSGLLPGSQGGMVSWLRSLLGNLAAFPTVLALLLIGSTIQSRLTADEYSGFIPPLVGTPGDDAARSIGAIIGLGIILIMPESVNLAKAAFKSPERKLASAIGQPISAGTGLVKAPFKGAFNAAWGDDKLGHPRALKAYAGKRAKAVGRVIFGSHPMPGSGRIGRIFGRGRRGPQTPTTAIPPQSPGELPPNLVSTGTPPSSAATPLDQDDGTFGPA